MADDRKKLSRNVWLLGWASLLNDVASEAIFPLMPRFLLDVLHGSTASLGVVEGLADSISSILKLWSGGWSDRAGTRKSFVVFGYALAALTRPLAGLAQAPWHLVVLRSTDRLGKGLRATPRDAMVVESTDPQSLGWAFGLQRAMDHLGAAIGPLLATLFLWIWPDQLRPLFLATIIPGLAVVALLAIGLREPPIQTQQRPRFSLSLRPLDANFRRYLLAVCLFTLGNSSDAFLLVRAGQLGVPELWLPILWLAFHIVKSAGSIGAGLSVNRLGARPMILAGWLLYAVVYVAFALASEAWQIWALFLVYGLYYAVTEPVEKKLVADLVPAERKGLAFGWYNFAVGIGALPASLLFGILYEKFGALVAFSCGAGLALLASMLLMTVTSTKQREPQMDTDKHR